MLFVGCLARLFGGLGRGTVDCWDYSSPRNSVILKYERRCRLMAILVYVTAAVIVPSALSSH